MINIRALSTKDIGRGVEFLFDSSEDVKVERHIIGKIKAWEKDVIFVVYEWGIYDDFMNHPGVPTNPAELKFVEEKERR